MSNAPAVQTATSDRFLVGLAGVIAAAAVVAAASSVLRLENIAARVDQLEKDKPALLQVGQQLGELSQQMRAMNKSVDDLREDLRAVRRQTPK